MIWKTSVTLAFAFALTSLGATANIAAGKFVSVLAGPNLARSSTVFLRLEFTTSENFTDDLANSSSQAFQDRTNMIKTQLAPVFQNAFTSFLQLTGINFSEDVGSGEGSGEGSGGDSVPGSGQESKILIRFYGFPFMEDPGKVLGLEEDTHMFDNKHLSSFRMNPTETLKRPLVTTADLAFNSSILVPSIDQVVTTLKQAISNGTVTIPIILSSISAIDIPPATIETPAASGSPTDPSSSGVSPAPLSVFSCSLLAWCTLLLAKMLNLS